VTLIFRLLKKKKNILDASYRVLDRLVRENVTNQQQATGAERKKGKLVWETRENDCDVPKTNSSTIGEVLFLLRSRVCACFFIASAKARPY
jgi:hypothetical protein